MNGVNVYLVLVLISAANSARILAFLPTPSISHMVIYHPIIRELSLRGHQVVAVLPDPINDPLLTNLTEINVHDVSYGIWTEENRLAETRIDEENWFQSFQHMMTILAKICDVQLAHPQVKELIANQHEPFDLVINEWLMYASTFAFGDYFNCPIVGISSMPLFASGHDSVGSPTHPAYAVDFWRSSGENLSFWQVLDNVLYSIVFRFYHHWVNLPRHDAIVRRHFGSDVRYVGDIERSVSLILLNTNPIFHVPRPLPPAVVEIGGIHMKDRNPLPADLKAVLDKAKEGVIYFSLGSNIKSSTLPKETIQIIIETFEKLPYTVLWKGDVESYSFSSKIKTQKWFPQQDVLDHPNVKLFVTQCGLQSVEESIRSRVPMIGIPFAGDQDYNADRILSLTIGQKIIVHDLNVKTFETMILEVIENPIYKERITEISNMLWDQPMKPLDRAVWWIEYVLRHKDAPGLRTPAADLPWYRLMLIDVGLFVAVVVWTLFSIIQRIKRYFLPPVSIRRWNRQSNRRIEQKNSSLTDILMKWVLIICLIILYVHVTRDIKESD